MNKNEFAKSTVVKVLSEMKNIREDNNETKYMLLIKTLEETLNILDENYDKKESLIFLTLLEKELETECDGIAKIANLSIEQLSFQSHLNWITSFSRVERIIEWIQNVTKNSLEPMEHTLLRQGVHTVISGTRLEAVAFIYNNFRRVRTDISFPKPQKRFTSDTQLIFTFGVDDISSNSFSGDVLHIDRNISLNKYLELIEPLIKRFKYVNVIN